MGRLDGRVAIVTGAGRGLGREHALFLAREGAAVVVNDLGGSVHGDGADGSPAQQVVAEIEAAGGRAVASGHDVSNWDGAGEMIQQAVDTFGELHVLVNNAGILRDRTIANMSEAEWDAVIKVHVKGHAGPTHHAMAHWRAQSKAGNEVKASIIMTSSLSGLIGNFGQANYATAKLGVVALARVASLEGERIGVRANAVSPGGRTRIAALWSGAESMAEPPPGVFDEHDPGNVSPIIGWLAERDCPANGQVLHLSGGQLLVMSMPPVLHNLKKDRRWTLEDFDAELTPRLVQPDLVEAFV
ncbi:MAG: SDR family NAD(P)-dependent oxidoreductase [Candidatus Dormibacteria bacterium]